MHLEIEHYLSVLRNHLPLNPTNWSLRNRMITHRYQEDLFSQNRLLIRHVNE